MNKTVCFLIVLTAIALATFIPASAQTPVVVELFTSEGCSSCPPADAVLLELSRQGQQNGANLILLGEHVDYWNYIGWTDRFSSKQFSQRQGDYSRTFSLGSVYTPQMVIDGSQQFVGNDLATVRGKIEAAAKQPKPAQVSLQWEGNSRLQVIVNAMSPLRARVFLAITQDGLTTEVGSGENGGRTLHHAAVVRQFREIGVAHDKKFETVADVSSDPAWKVAQLKLAVLVQDPATGKILGAAETTYPK